MINFDDANWLNLTIKRVAILRKPIADYNGPILHFALGFAALSALFSFRGRPFVVSSKSSGRYSDLKDWPLYIPA